MAKIKGVDFPLDNVITVDPGWNTGLAIWLGDDSPLTFLIKEPPKNKKIRIEPERLNEMFLRFKTYIVANTPHTVYIEGVEMWRGNTKSMTAAARGNLFSLAYLIGGYTEICQRSGANVKYLYPRGGKGKDSWKGQLPSSAIKARIKRINGREYPEHIQEAVAMGFKVMGIL